MICQNYIKFPGGSDGKESACNAGDPGLIPGSGRTSGEGNGNPLQYSCLENPMDGGAWRATVHGVVESETTEWLHFHFLFFFSFIYLFSLQYCSGFCHILTWIRHRYTCVPHPEPTSLPIASLWVIPVHQPRAPCLMHWTWTGDSFHIW